MQRQDFFLLIQIDRSHKSTYYDVRRHIRRRAIDNEEEELRSQGDIARRICHSKILVKSSYWEVTENPNTKIKEN